MLKKVEDIERTIKINMDNGYNHISVVTTALSHEIVPKTYIGNGLRVGKDPHQTFYSHNRHKELIENDLLIELDPTHEIAISEIAVHMAADINIARARKGRTDWCSPALRSVDHSSIRKFVFQYDCFTISVAMKQGSIRCNRPYKQPVVLAKVVNYDYINLDLSSYDPISGNMLIVFDLYKMGTFTDNQRMEAQIMYNYLLNSGRSKGDLRNYTEHSATPYIMYNTRENKYYMGLYAIDDERCLSKHPIAEHNHALTLGAKSVCEKWLNDLKSKKIIGVIEHLILLGVDIGKVYVYRQYRD